MKKYDVFASEGGYRVCLEAVNGGPVMKKSPWYDTKKSAVSAKNIIIYNHKRSGEYVYTSEDIARS